MPSSRSSFDLAPNRLALALARARQEERAILDLTESNPTRAGLPYARATILEALASPDALLYEPSPFGLWSAREVVARELEVDPARVLLTASTSEAYGFLFKLLCDPGDEVLVPVPSYPLFEHLARLEAVRAVPYRLAYDGRWHVDVDSLRSAVGPRTRAVVTVSPNNPTGSYLKHAELAALASLGLPIVSDEVFASYPLRDDPTRATTALEAQGTLVFSLGGLSKLAALPQMKLAWIVVGGDAPDVTDALARLEVLADAYLSVGTPVQHALPHLLASRVPAESAIQARTRTNLELLRSRVSGTAGTLLDVEGGWYATLRVPATRSEEAWALELLEEDGVHVHPGHFFDFEHEAYLVLSLLTPEAIFAEGVGRVVTRLAREG
ncbi:MAG TPA: pyridoxal phosphate-dependent aminotransferase [Polyangiaceae bacterium]|nr:pyridoxal phosphate-dependent aminotransferase [Polyangiaceae bacterium]